MVGNHDSMVGNHDSHPFKTGSLETQALPKTNSERPWKMVVGKFLSCWESLFREGKHECVPFSCVGNWKFGHIIILGFSGWNTSHKFTRSMRVFPRIGVPPKWMVYNQKAYKNGWFGGPTPIFGNTHEVILGDPEVLKCVSLISQSHMN